jgi:hypothetical protein
MSHHEGKHFEKEGYDSPIKEASNPFSKSRFPRRRAKITNGETWESSGVHGRLLLKWGTVLEKEFHESVLETGVSSLTGMEDRSDRSSLTESEILV